MSTEHAIPVATREILREHFATRAEDAPLVCSAGDLCPIATYVREAAGITQVYVNPYNFQRISGGRVNIVDPYTGRVVRRDMIEEELAIARAFDTLPPTDGEAGHMRELTNAEVVAFLDAYAKEEAACTNH